MPARHFTYTIPSSIEGESADVVVIAKRQIQELAAVVAELAADTFIQLRAAGIDPESEDAVKAWLDSDEGGAAADLVWGAQAFAEVAKQL